jgi:hypothetical protein
MSITGDNLAIGSQHALEAGSREVSSLQGRFEPTQNRENNTGMPDTLKAGIETLSGLSMDDVNVHYNSSKPAQVQALAYTQGTDIHVGPGQEKHLAHEAWHVVQQKQGRVRPTWQAKSVAINDDQGLEREADVMGEQAEKASGRLWHRNSTGLNLVANGPIQRQSGSLVIQMNAAADLLAAEANRVYLVAETGLLSTAGSGVYTAINGTGAGQEKDDAAAGLRYYWQTLIDGFDGKKAEMYEAETLVANGDIPILSTNDLTDPDVRINIPGGVEATEVKAINSDNTANVNTLITGADKQLGKRYAKVKKIKIRIESRNNLWPDIRYNNLAYITNDTDLKNWIGEGNVIPGLQHANQIQIEGINVPYGGPGLMRNYWAKVKGDGTVRKSGSLVW